MPTLLQVFMPTQLRITCCVTYLLQMALRCACDCAGLRPRPAGKQNTAGQPKAKIDDPEGDAYKKAQLGASARVRTGHNTIAHTRVHAHNHNRTHKNTHTHTRIPTHT